jgi:mxaJ protein
MYSRCPDAKFAILVVALCCAATASAASRELRVCADPDNLPYSHRDETGFENRIARVIADELHAELSYTWVPLQRGFVRKTLNAGLCDVLIGVPSGFDPVLTTAAYYRSAYVFVHRSDRPAPESFADPALQRARIGVPLVGDDGAATPPGHAVISLGMTHNVAGYTAYGDAPQAQRMVAAVASGELDLAIVWGPQAAYYARMQPTPLKLAYIPPPDGLPVPFEFSMAMAVRKRDGARRAELDAVIQRRRKDLDSILQSYGVPRTDPTTAAQERAK